MVKSVVYNKNLPVNPYSPLIADGTDVQAQSPLDAALIPSTSGTSEETVKAKGANKHIKGVDHLTSVWCVLTDIATEFGQRYWTTCYILRPASTVQLKL